jgi:Lipid-droplet associated hydrolase
LYNLQGQVNHKIEFISKFVPKGVKIHLVSHSIGSKISLELLKDNNMSYKIHQCYLLFPTIERMVDSNNGFWFYKVFNPIFFLLRLFYYAFSFLPLIVRTIILYIFCYCSGIPEYFLGTVIKTSSPTVLDKVWFMAEDEMQKVCDIDDEVIMRNLHRLKFYYSTFDGWVPIDYYKNVIERFPGIDAELCQRSINHGFVISHGPTMGRMVSEWIHRKKIAKSS